MDNVIGYYRVSSEEQAEKDISIPAQKKAIRKYADKELEFNFVSEFVDKGHSAYAPADKRPGFCEMISYCKKNPVKYILVHKLDRFSRNREESIIFKSLLKKNGVTVKSITEDFDSETPQGFLYEGMIEVINQFYSMNLATETIKGMKENASRGFVNGGAIAYGMKAIKIKDSNGQEKRSIAPGNPDHIKVVQQMYEWSVKEEMGIGAVTNRLNERKILSPGGGLWSKSVVNYILNNRTYIGDLIWKRSLKNGRSRKAAPKDEWIVVENAHEGIIDKELFWKRKSLIKDRGFENFNNPKRYVKWLLSRLIVCGECGANYFGARHSRRTKKGTSEHRYYICGSYSSKGKIACKRFTLPRELIEGAVIEVIAKRICTPKTIEQLEELTRKKLLERQKQYGKPSTSIRQRIANIDRKIENYYLALGDGFDREKCTELIEKLNAEKDQLEKEAAILRKEDYYSKAMENTMRKVKLMAGSFREDFKKRSFAEKRKVIEFFVDHIDIVDHKKAVIHFKIPMDNGEVTLLAGPGNKKAGPSKRPGYELTDDTGKSISQVLKWLRSLIAEF